MASRDRILIVDDDEAHRLLVRRALKPITLRTSEAGSIDEALAVLEETGNDIAMILLDMNLAGVPSLQILQNIRGKFAFDLLPVVVLSTSALDKDVFEAYAAGVNCYLIKSADPEQFRTMITAAVRFFSDKSHSA